MLQAIKNFARSILALPYDGGIFKERPSDPIEKWNWCRQHKLFSVVVLYSEDCLASELAVRTAVAMEPDLRNTATPVFLSDRQMGARELASQLAPGKMPAIVFCDREGHPLRSWGTTFNPVEVLAVVAATVKAQSAS